MSERSGASIATRQGELISIRIGVEANFLEDLLETLAELPFDINPQILHHLPGRYDTAIEFPGYDPWMGKIRKALAQSGFPATSLQARPMIEELQAH